MNNLADFEVQLTKLTQQGQKRQFPSIQHQGKWIWRDNIKMLNMSSNDYLGLASDEHLREQFLTKLAQNLPLFSSSSSRLLTGNFPIYEQLEQLLAQRFQRESALIFNSGYHANIGILPALCDKHTLIVADKLVHASLIDGIRLSGCEFVRYRHNDDEHLYQLVDKHHKAFKRIIIVTESLFSMDGDRANLPYLVALKQQFGNVLLYVDEAHAVGCYGEQGLGLAEEMGCIAQIDLLVGTFGKALASMGAYVVCDEIIKDYLINQMRPLIFSTALPPFNVAWTHFLFEQLPHWQARRSHLAQLSEQLRQTVAQYRPMPSNSHIVPYILGDNHRTVAMAQQFQQQGYYCLPIRPPTVPQHTARIRLSLTVDMSVDEINHFIQLLHHENEIN